MDLEIPGIARQDELASQGQKPEQIAQPSRLLDRTSPHQLTPRPHSLRDYSRLLASFEPERLGKWHNGRTPGGSSANGIVVGNAERRWEFVPEFDRFGRTPELYVFDGTRPQSGQGRASEAQGLGPGS